MVQEVGACRESGSQRDLLGSIGPEGKFSVAKVCTEPNISSELVGLNGIVGPMSQVNRATVDESTPLIISGDHVGKKMSPISKLESVGLTQHVRTKPKMSNVKGSSKRKTKTSLQVGSSTSTTRKQRKGSGSRFKRSLSAKASPHIKNLCVRDEVCSGVAIELLTEAVVQPRRSQ